MTDENSVVVTLAIPRQPPGSFKFVPVQCNFLVEKPKSMSADLIVTGEWKPSTASMSPGGRGALLTTRQRHVHFASQLERVRPDRTE